MHILESPLDDAFLSAEAVEGVEEEAALAPIIVDIPKPPMPSPPIINSSLRQTLVRVFASSSKGMCVFVLERL
jgi:hypothetical protein